MPGRLTPGAAAEVVAGVAGEILPLTLASSNSSINWQIVFAGLSTCCSAGSVGSGWSSSASQEGAPAAAVEWRLALFLFFSASSSLRAHLACFLWAASSLMLANQSSLEVSFLPAFLFFFSFLLTFLAGDLPSLVLADSFHFWDLGWEEEVAWLIGGPSSSDDDSGGVVLLSFSLGVASFWGVPAFLFMVFVCAILLSSASRGLWSIACGNSIGGYVCWHVVITRD